MNQTKINRSTIEQLDYWWKKRKRK